MRFVAFVIFTFAMCFVLYYMGYQPIASHWTGNDTGTFKGAAMNSSGDPNIVQYGGACDPSNLTNCYSPTTSDVAARPHNDLIGAILGIFLVGIVSLVILVTGFSAVYVIPALILIVLTNFFILPWDFLLGSPFQVPVMVFFNTITVLAAVNFIRGGT
jgi:hypothetical protein